MTDFSVTEELELLGHVAPTNGAPPQIDPSIALALAAIEAVGGPDDTRPEIDVLADLDGRVEQLARTLGGLRREERAEKLGAEIERLREAVLDPEHGAGAIGRLREAIAARRRVLGLDDARPVATLAERLRARLDAPPLVHVATGLPTLDAATRGGLLMRRVHVIGGEPDAGKTALLVQLLLAAARDGFAVGLYAVDEPGEGIEDRIGQSLGLALDELEANVRRALEWLCQAVASMPNVLLIEQGEGGFLTIEDAADAVIAHARRHRCRGAILGIDSLQTAHCRAFFGPNAPRLDRDRIEAMTAATKEIARRGAMVIATSELGRASYASKPGAKPPSPMAAFKGSGSIEYAMTVGLVLTRITKGEYAGDVRVGVPKNKRGAPEYRGMSLRLERDPDRCTYTDRGRLDLDEQEAAPTKAAKPASDVSAHILDRVRAELKKHARGVAGGVEGLAELVGGKRAATRKAIHQLETAGEIVRAGGRMFHSDAQAAAPKADPSAEELRRRVLAWVRGEHAAGRLVPSANAVVGGLREAGVGARRTAVQDAIDVLVHQGDLDRDERGRLSL